MTLLTTIQDATDLIGVPRPSAIISSTDQQVRQLYSLANEDGDALMRRYAWQILTSQQTFTTVAAAAQTTGLPTDWQRFINESMWNRTQRRPVLGPIDANDWQAIQANVAIGTINQWFRLRGGQFLMTPTPAAGDTVAYEYVSVNWCADNSAIPKARYTADNDVARIPERLISLGVVWRFKSAKGLDYAESLSTYEREVETAIAQDKGLKTIPLSRLRVVLPTAYVPEGSWS